MAAMPIIGCLWGGKFLGMVSLEKSIFPGPRGIGDQPGSDQGYFLQGRF